MGDMAWHGGMAWQTAKLRRAPVLGFWLWVWGLRAWRERKACDSPGLRLY